MIKENEPKKTKEIIANIAKNQDGHLTLKNRELKKCNNCGEDIECIAPPVISGGKEIYPSTIKPIRCSCRKEEDERLKAEKEKQAKNELLMKYYKAAEIPPLFLRWDFSNIERKDNRTNIEFCESYVNCFESNLLTTTGIFMVGDVGTRKSTLAYCMVKELIKKGYSARVVSFGKIIRELQSTYSPNCLKTYDDVLNDLIKFDFTVIDDLAVMIGANSYTDKQLQVALDFIDLMSTHCKCVAITANSHNIHTMKRYGDKFTPMLDRLNQMCNKTLVFSGNSYRGNDK